MIFYNWSAKHKNDVSKNTDTGDDYNAFTVQLLLWFLGITFMGAALLKDFMVVFIFLMGAFLFSAPFLIKLLAQVEKNREEPEEN